MRPAARRSSNSGTATTAHTGSATAPASASTEANGNDAGDNDDDLPTVKHGLDTDGQGHAGYLADVVSEEACVGEDGVIRKSLDARARGE